MLYCSGTDSYRLARKTIELGSSQDFNITIPSKIFNGSGPFRFR